MNNKGFLNIFAGKMAVEVGFIAFMMTMTALNLGSPTIKHNHRVKRAIEICEFNNGIGCDSVADNLTEDELLAYIRDDASNYDFYHQEEKVVKKGGKLRTRLLAKQ